MNKVEYNKKQKKNPQKTKKEALWKFLQIILDILPQLLAFYHNN